MADITAERQGDAIHVIRPWRARRHIGAAISGLAIAGLFVFKAVAGTLYISDPIFAAALTAGGLVLIYYSIVGFVNRTTVIISADNLVVLRGPLPFFTTRRRMLPPLRDVTTYHDRVITPRTVGETYAVQGILQNGSRIVIDLFPTQKDAINLSTALRAAITDAQRHP